VFGSNRTKPAVEYRNPVELWCNCTFLGGVETPEALPSYAARMTIKLETADHFLEMLKQLLNGVETQTKTEMFSFTVLHLTNEFQMRDAHPTHARKCTLHMLLTTCKRDDKGVGGGPSTSTPVLIELNHKDVLRAITSDDSYLTAYHFFRDRNLGMTAAAFDAKFEVLLSFLVEAIGVPVLLSLLLLTCETAAPPTPLPLTSSCSV
jgi:hypothetical protein